MKADTNASHFGFHDWGKPADQAMVDMEMKLERLRGNSNPHVMKARDMTVRHMMIEPLPGVNDMPISPQSLQV